MMDRTYGVSAGELRGDDINLEMLNKHRELNKQIKEKRLFEITLNGIFEVALKSLELKENPLLNLTSKEKGVVILAISDNVGDKFERLKILTELKLDAANIESRKFIEVNWNTPDVAEFYKTVLEFLNTAEKSQILKDIKSLNKVKGSINVYLTDKVVEKYTEMNSQLDKRTLVYLIENGLLK